jgi:hypothetical protein
MGIKKHFFPFQTQHCKEDTHRLYDITLYTTPTNQTHFVTPRDMTLNAHVIIKVKIRYSNNSLLGCDAV